MENIDIIMPIYHRNVNTEKSIQSIKDYTQNYNLILVEKMNSTAQNINEGLAQVKSEWFVIIDDDIFVSPGWLEKLKEHRNKDVGQIQPKILYPIGRMIWSADVGLNPLRQKGHLSLDQGQFNYIKEAEMLTGGCCLYNSEILKKGIKEDENYKGSQFNDIDFTMQIRKAGYKLIYNGNCEVVHLHMFRQPNRDNCKIFYSKWGDNGILY